MYKNIDDYGIIGNLHSGALIGRDGSIDWCCLPCFDSPSVFAALLDEGKGGFFSICPTGEWDSVSRYLKTTNILTTSFRTRTGVMVLTDFMPVAEDDAEDSERPEIYRMVQVVEGEMEVQVEFVPRFDYARAETTLAAEGNGIRASGGGHSLALCCSLPGLQLEGDRAIARWQLKKGHFTWLYLKFDSHVCHPFDPKDGGRALRRTEAFWHNWLRTTETGGGVDLGPFQDAAERSALVLKLLQFRPTGAIAAAATTSLPEEIGGVRNWDYRFSWVRDSALTIDALFNIGHLTEAERYLAWIEKLIRERGAALQVLYDLQGEKIRGETILDHLDGYKGSRPVRVGNAAAAQRQLDIYGEIMDAALKLARYVGKIDLESWTFLREIGDAVVAQWREKDNSIWEVRGGPFHFVFSKVMCWVALDRGIVIARRYGFPADLEKWEATKEEIRREVMAKGWNEEKRSFVQHYETDAVDASALLLPVFGFLPFDDPKMVATVEAVRRELGHEGFIYRYRVTSCDDGLPGQEGVFLICSFWMIQNLIGQGKLEEAERDLHHMLHLSNPLGLFSEQYDLHWQCALGNFPQALSHIGFINSVVALCQARGALRPRQKKERDLTLYLREKVLVGSDFVLNAGELPKQAEPQEIAPRLKHLMNLLQGGFFQSSAGRVAYEKMRDSDLYEQYRQGARQLRDMDLSVLENRAQRLAFWINIYNVMVIDGVIALGIRDSVREVPRFFRRIRYRIGGQEFSADDIEHGILRGNRRLPNSLFRPFGRSDRRRELVIEKFEPRIHFALVCASRSCPPIGIYQAERLEDQLAVSARTFINSGGLRLDRETSTVYLSEIFRWYADDFGKTAAERLRFAAAFLYRGQDRAFIDENAEELRIDFSPYDWRLNRS